MPADKKQRLKSRCGVIDAVRGAAVLSMVAYHLCYDIFMVFGVDTGFEKYWQVALWERTICFTFIIVSGIAVNLSKHGYRRGLVLNLCGFIITAATLIVTPQQQIWFGVLNLLGCSMLIVFALRKALKRIRPAAGMAASLGLFALLFGVPEGYIGLPGLKLIVLPEQLYGCRYLAFLGFPSDDFVSADYFPILPWIFLFVFGFFLWRFIEERRLQRRFTAHVPVLGFIGRQSLWIYMLHQPLLYGLCLLIFGTN